VYNTVYILQLKCLVSPSPVVWITCTGCSKSNCMKIIFRSQQDTAFFYSWPPAESNRIYSSSWNCHLPCFFDILSCKWTSVSMECYHNLDKPNLHQLLSQLSVIFNNIYQVMQSAHFDSSDSVKLNSQYKHSIFYYAL
jgi:hypothetical protein